MTNRRNGGVTLVRRSLPRRVTARAPAAELPNRPPSPTPTPPPHQQASARASASGSGTPTPSPPSRRPARRGTCRHYEGVACPVLGMVSASCLTPAQTALILGQRRRSRPPRESWRSLGRSPPSVAVLTPESERLSLRPDETGPRSTTSPRAWASASKPSTSDSRTSDLSSCCSSVAGLKISLVISPVDSAERSPARERKAADRLWRGPYRPRTRRLSHAGSPRDVALFRPVGSLISQARLTRGAGSGYGRWNRPLDAGTGLGV
jgi:hypothetical protein